MRPETTEVSAEAIDRCLEVLGQSPAGLLTDIDGTVSAMARTPEEATIVPLAQDALRRIQQHLALVGIVTGRSARVGEALVGLPDLVYVGNHGMEWVERGELHRHAEAAAWSDHVRESLIEIAEAARRGDFEEGLIVEDKGLSGSIHYRLAPDIAATYERLAPAARIVTERRGLRMTEGHLVLEVRPPVQITKGTALIDLVTKWGLRGIVFLGDDVTDVDAFRAVRTLREEHGVAGLRVGVVAPETAQAVLDESDVTVNGVEACAMLLATMADRLGEAPAPG